VAYGLRLDIDAAVVTGGEEGCGGWVPSDGARGEGGEGVTRHPHLKAFSQSFGGLLWSSFILFCSLSSLALIKAIRYQSSNIKIYRNVLVNGTVVLHQPALFLSSLKNIMTKVINTENYYREHAARL
jgi:hypothetical protein